MCRIRIKQFGETGFKFVEGVATTLAQLRVVESRLSYYPESRFVQYWSIGDSGDQLLPRSKAIANLKLAEEAAAASASTES